MAGRRRNGGPRVLGPYWEESRQQWRYTIVEADGTRRQPERLPRGTSELKAQREVELVRKGLATLTQVQTVDDGVDAYIAHLVRRGASEATQKWAREAAGRLSSLFGSLELVSIRWHHLRAVLDAMDAPQARPGRAGKPLALATRASYWRQMERITAWWARRGYTNTDVAADLVLRLEREDQPLPWTTLDGQRDMERGKVQLRGAGEVLTYVEAALREPTPDRRVAAVLPLLTGLDSGETRHLRRRDVDLAGSAIWIGVDHKDWRPKRSSRARTVPIPDCLRGDIEALCATSAPRPAVPSALMTVAEYAAHRERQGLRGGVRAVYKALSTGRIQRTGGLIDAAAADAMWPHHAGDVTGPAAPWTPAEGPDAYLFARRDRDGAGRPHDRTWLRDLVRHVCEVAGLPMVPPHGLRGTYTTMLQELSRRSMQEIALAVGHSDSGQTARRHYVGGAEHRPALQVVLGGVKGRAGDDVDG